MSGTHNKFKVGDVVICVDPGAYRAITWGKLYTVQEVAPNTVRVVGDAGKVEGFFPYRFEKVVVAMKTVTLNGVEYQVENIPGKGECLVPVKRTPQAGEVWIGPQGGTYIVVADDETTGFEFKSNNVYTIPKTASFAARNLSEYLKINGGI